MTTLDRFMDFVSPVPNSRCWLWTGALVSDTCRYGVFWDLDTNFRAHRWIYETLVGSIDIEKIVHHKCENTICVNPDHLEQITQSDHLGKSKLWLEKVVESNKLRAKERTHCINGHKFTAENTRMYKGRRICRACGRNRQRRYLHGY